MKITIENRFIEKPRHRIKFYSLHELIIFGLQNYFVSVFAVARDRRLGSLLATGIVRPRTSTAKKLRENVPMKADIKGKSVYYLKVSYRTKNPISATLTHFLDTLTSR